jgi:hypothetical protein
MCKRRVIREESTPEPVPSDLLRKGCVLCPTACKGWQAKPTLLAGDKHDIFRGYNGNHMYNHCFVLEPVHAKKWKATLGLYP